MTSYDGYNYTWTNGNELKSITKDSNEYKYEYSIDGIRTKKTVNGKVTNYYLEGSNIIYEDRDGKVISYLYDESGISGFIFNNKTYYFVKNVQGDIIEVLDEKFETVAKYTYDNWGVVTTENLTEENIGDINPYRYRGYYYDVETKLYYLDSRYYHPELGRFISADSILGANEDMLSYNLYIYCSNNPIMYSDPSGMVGDLITELFGWVTSNPLEALTAVLVGGTNAVLFTLGVVVIVGIAEIGYNEIQSKKTKSPSKKDNEKEEHYVYLLRDSNHVVQYVGRTQDLEATKRRHGNNPARSELEMFQTYGPMNKLQARGMEEIFIYYYSTLNRNNKTNNQIHGISLKNPNRLNYIDYGYRWYADTYETYVGG